jgi:hypothetical protein
VKGIPIFLEREKIKKDAKDEVRFDIFKKQVDKVFLIF